MTKYPNGSYVQISYSDGRGLFFGELLDAEGNELVHSIDSKLSTCLYDLARGIEDKYEC
jgi:hypothetical protein